MKRFFLFNGVVAIVFLVSWFGINALSITLSWQVALAMLAFFLLAFYRASFVTLRRQFPRAAIFLSILSAVGWSTVTLIVSAFILISLFGLGPCL
jgi:hypothetical protein